MKFYWHIHHDMLCEPLTEPLRNRIKYIKENKPKNEIELRLKLLKPVKGELPKRVVKARKAYVKAGKAYDKAWKACDKAGKDLYKAGKACDKAEKAYYKAEKAYFKARKAYDKTLTMKSLLALHKKECGCGWNGESIFNKLRVWLGWREHI